MPSSSTATRAPLSRCALGIDVSKADFHVRLLGAGATAAGRPEVRSLGRRKFANAPAGFAALDAWLRRRLAAAGAAEAPLAIAMEATGVYHEGLAYDLHDRGHAISIQLPNKVQHYIRSLGEASETDDLDAYAIARMGLERDLRTWEAPSPARRGLRVLTREYEALHEQLTAVRNQYAAVKLARHTPPRTLARYEAHVALLGEHLTEVEAAMATVTAGDEGLAREVGLLTSIPGVALETACVILAETDGFALFARRGQLVKFAGYDIVYKQSGTSVKGRTRISKRGNGHLRRALFFPVFSAVRVAGPFRAIYERVYARTRCKMVANVAVQRKLLITMMALVKSGRAYDPEHYRKHRDGKRRGGSSSSEASSPVEAPTKTGRPEGQPAVDAASELAAP